MKKIIILFLAALIVIVPLSSSYGGELSLMDSFFDNDIQLESLTEQYASLLENQEDNLEFYENYRINQKSAYSIALGNAAKENGISRVDWDISNGFYNIKAREALLEINFRNTLLSLANKVNYLQSSRLAKFDAIEQYEEVLSNHSKGYVSDIALLEAEYASKKADNTYSSALRSSFSLLRTFNIDLGGTLEDYDLDVELDINEVPLQVADLNEYIESATNYSPLIVLPSQTLASYETELKHLNSYTLPENISYVREKLESVELNLALSKLILEKNSLSVIKDIENQYNLIVIEKEKLDLANLSVEIAKTNHEINKDLYNRSLISYSELLESEETMESVKMEYRLAVYDYNTMVMELEYDSAYFMTEDNE